jgi:uncharacterized protein (DUF1810 family)
MPDRDPFDLARFIGAQHPVFEGVLSELRAGRKLSHWMWFIFPQIDGLGFSSTTRLYSIKSPAEALAYLEHPVLGPRLLKCAEILLSLDGRSAGDIFGAVDALKLRSSMTLFAHVGGPGSACGRVLDKYFTGVPDPKTLQLLRADVPPAGDAQS